MVNKKQISEIEKQNIEKMILRLVYITERKWLGYLNKNIEKEVDNALKLNFKNNEQLDTIMKIKEEVFVNLKDNIAIFGLDHFSHFCKMHDFESSLQEYYHETEVTNRFKNKSKVGIKR